MRSIKISILALTLSLGVAFTANAQSTATEFVRQKSDEIIRVINTSSNAQTRVNNLRSTVRTTLNFELLAQRSLGAHWNTLTPAQRTEFTSTLRDVVEHTYARKLGNERITPGSYSVVFSDERERRGNYTVEGRVTTGGKEYHIAVRLLRATSGEWQLFDVITDDISLQETYAESFHEIITKHGYDELLRRLKARQGV